MTTAIWVVDVSSGCQLPSLLLVTGSHYDQLCITAEKPSIDPSRTSSWTQ